MSLYGFLTTLLVGGLFLFLSRTMDATWEMLGAKEDQEGRRAVAEDDDDAVTLRLPNRAVPSPHFEIFIAPSYTSCTASLEF